MNTAFFSKNLRFVAAFILLGTSAVLSAADRKFSTSTSLSTEARTLIQLLEQAHFNRDDHVAPEALAGLNTGPNLEPSDLPSSPDIVLPFRWRRR